MSFEQIKQKDKQYIANTYNRFELDVESGSGVNCADSDGKSLIDLSSGIGVNSLGFANEKWTTAVKAQIDKLNHISNLYYTQPQTLLAEKLCKMSGMEKVFFANSGAEANEGAIKTARKYSSDKYGDNRYEIITLINSFHGRTIATLSATGQETFHHHFGPFVDGFLYAEANNLDSVKALISGKTAAIFIECIQGEGGVIALDKNFVEGIQQICNDNDILLMVDEVQTGVGRTGKFLCSEYYDMKPDIITLAKGLGGGLPIGAVLFGEKTQSTLGYGDHGTTFGGNPIVCAGAMAVLDSIDGEFLENVFDNSKYTIDSLLQIPQIEAVSGKGLMLGITLKGELKAVEVVKKAAENGLILLTAKEKLRLLPPLNITKDEIDKAIEILKQTIESII